MFELQLHFADKDYEFDIYGNEKKVHETKYAASCFFAAKLKLK
jgi:hypothetical protein